MAKGKTGGNHHSAAQIAAREARMAARQLAQAEALAAGLTRGRHRTNLREYVTRTPEIEDEIVFRHAHGEFLAHICKQEGMPHLTTLTRWRKDDPAFDKRIIEARETFADHVASDIIDIADDSENDFNDETGKFRKDHVQRSRLRAEMRLKLLERMDPRYSARMALTGKDGGALQIEALPDHALEASLAKELAKAGLPEEAIQAILSNLGKDD